jgi:hypothetical protein
MMIMISVAKRQITPLYESARYSTPILVHRHRIERQQTDISDRLILQPVPSACTYI